MYSGWAHSFHCTPGQSASTAGVPDLAEVAGVNYITKRYMKRQDTFPGLPFCPKLTFNTEQNVTFASAHHLKISPHAAAIRKAFKN